MLLTFSKGIKAISGLEALLGSPISYCYSFYVRGNYTGVIGWGLKSTSMKARAYAKSHNLPYIALEDGFLRSVGLGVEGASACSLVVDLCGIYYDATQPSDLESLIVNADYSSEELQRASAAMAEIKSQRLSKYNHTADFCPAELCDEVERVLVVDQTYGDASITLGRADSQSFEHMLSRAIADNPGAQIVVKTHPDVIAGKKRGHLNQLAVRQGCTLLLDDVNPWAILDQVQKVYVVTSQLGFEALMAGKEVHCFGMPFYAGWGLTIDQHQSERRGHKRTLVEVFYAAYIQYCRYINPYTGQRCQLEDTIKLIVHQKRHLECYRGRWLAINFSKWKRNFIPSYLGLGANISFTKHLKKDIDQLKAGDNLLVWSNRIDKKTENLCQKKSLKLWGMEDGFLRSVGLGADLVPPLSLVVDSCGIYYDSNKPSDLENLINTYSFDNNLLIRARKIRRQLVGLRLSKYNVGVTAPLILPSDKKIILVPGQVETDASIVKGSPIIQTNHALLKVVRKKNPNAFIIYKPHPDVLGGGRFGELDAAIDTLHDLVVADISITDLFDRVDEVHTMSSLSGFEALLREKTVFTYGMPFYAGWGLTVDYLSCKRRNKVLTLDQLVAAALILYPIYTDPDSGDVIDIESAIELMSRKLVNKKDISIKTRLYRVFRNAFLKR